MEHTPLLVPFLQTIGISIALAGVFGLMLSLLSFCFGKKKEKIIDVEFTEIKKTKPYEPGDVVDKTA